jgi:hypothetical protein
VLGVDEADADAVVRQMGERSQRKAARALQDPKAAAHIRRRAMSVRWVQQRPDGGTVVVAPREMRKQLRRAGVTPRARTRLPAVRRRPRGPGARRVMRCRGPDADDGSGEDEPPYAAASDVAEFSLSRVDRWPLLWRLRAARCAFWERREGLR